MRFTLVFPRKPNTIEPVAQHCSNRVRHGSGGDLGLPMTEHVDAGLSDRAAGQ
jgi:hypothetical protein